MALTGALKAFMDDFSGVEKELAKSEIIKNAKDSISSALENSEVSLEERDKLFSNFMQQISLGLVGQAVEIVKVAAPSKAAEAVSLADLKQRFGITLDSDGNEVDSGKGVYREQSMLEAAKVKASLEKEFGFTIDSDGKLKNTGKGMLDIQADGFYKQNIAKALRIFSEEKQMLAQADQVPPQWMIDFTKIGAEILTDGKINLWTENGKTVVRYVHEATRPDGL